MPSQSAPSPQTGNRSKSQKGDLEYQRQVAQRLLGVLDERSLWSLTHELERRGFIRVTRGALEVVKGDDPSVTAAARAVEGDGPTRSQSELAAAGAGATPADVKKNAQVGAAAPAAVKHRAARPRANEARRGRPPASRGKPSYSLAAAALGQEAAVTGGPIGAGPERSNVAPDLGSGQEKDKADEDACTTLILRNMPSDFDQRTTEEWVSSRGYEGLYDFLLWFPAKKTTRLSASSYAFVNFRLAEDARRFRSENHLTRLCAGKWALSIAAAKVQGFAENYVRFHHLTGEGSPTLCRPFFARDSADKLSEEAHGAAASAARAAPQQAGPKEGPCTTLVIRNLPRSVDSQEGARDWLSRAGFADEYDFLLYLPAKRRRPEPPNDAGGPPQGLAYAFVNFAAPGAALACIEALSGREPSDGDPALNVVAARVQGLSECLRHFSGIGGNGRVAPWVAQGASRERRATSSDAVPRPGFATPT